MPYYGPKKAPELENILPDFINHSLDHTAEVMEKGERFQIAVESMAEKRTDLPVYAAVRKDTMQLALEMHDIGMAGKENQLELFENSNNLRKDSEALAKGHAYRSAAMILSDAEWIRDQRGSNTEVEKAALIAYFHDSKSAGGQDARGKFFNLADLGNLREAIIGFERKYNEEQGADGKPVELSSIYNNQEELKQIATGASIARLADSYRDGIRTSTMLGEKISPDYENFKPNPLVTDVDDEVAGVNVKFISKSGVRWCKNTTLKVYAVGETNISRMEMHEQDGKLIHEFDITNGDKFKFCINQMLEERIAEIDSGIFSERKRPEGAKSFHKIKINLKDCDEQSAAAFANEFNRLNKSYKNLVEWTNKLLIM